MASGDVSGQQDVAAVMQTTSFRDGWDLRVNLHPGHTMKAELRRGDIVYTLVTADTALIEAVASGALVEMSVDNEGRPTILWRASAGSSPFVWFCGIGVASWSHPL